MKLVVKGIAEFESFAMYLDTPLFPCHNDSEFYLKGYIEFGDYFRTEGKNQILVAVWDKNYDWGYYYDDVLEYLLVEVNHIEDKKSSNPNMPYLHSATVIEPIPKDKVEVIPADTDGEPNMFDRVFLLSKKLI
jgi:hypothetical protein